jgi:hypothetical protein
MTTKTVLIGIVIAAAAGPALAGSIYRCTGPGGAVTYQEIACAGEDTGGPANIPTSFPEANMAERNRILQQEAMLDERLLRRAQIDSTERIARDDRAVREREAEARMAEAEAMQASGYGYPLFAVPGRFVNRNNLMAKRTINNRPHVEHHVRGQVRNTL